MGAWGPGLYQDDLALDVQDTYVSFLKDHTPDEQITGKILEEFRDALSDDDDEPIVWFALADTQWKWGRLEEPVKKRALAFIDSGKDLSKWCNSSKSAYKKRVEVLNMLKERLNSPQKNKRIVRQPKLYTCKWKTGDVYAYPLTSTWAQEAGLEGTHLLFHKCGETTDWPGHIVPVVRIKLYKSHDHLPTLKDFQSLSYLKIYGAGHKDEGKYVYRIKLMNTSARAIPKTLFFIGNIDEFETLNDEWAFPDDDYLWGALWKWFDKLIIHHICEYNQI